ncbi:MAG: hypothetical protein AAF492_16610 [Verrucomicrobiota bacterium]
MRKGLPWLLAGLLLWGTVTSARAEKISIKTWQEAMDSGVSKMGRKALRDHRSVWSHAADRHFFYHGRGQAVLGEVAEEAAFATKACGRWLSIKPSRKPAHIFIIHSRDRWLKLAAGSRLRLDGKAFHHDNEIYVFRDPEKKIHLEIFHEAVHLYLTRAYGRDIPLWLEEGLAVYYGWKNADAFYASKELTLSRLLPRIDLSDAFSLNVLLTMKSYPRKTEANRVYYRQTGALMAALVEMMSEDEVSRLTRLIVRGDKKLVDVLKKHYAWDAARFKRLEKSMLEGINPDGQTSIL